jgi:hypothetical protein
VTQPATGHLHVSASLDLEVDGQAVHVRGDGQDIVVSAPDVVALAQQLHVTKAALDRGVTGNRRALRRFANAADRAGIRVEIVGRTGPVAAVGRDVDVRVMRWLTGSPHVSINPSRESLSALAGLLTPQRTRNAVTRLLGRRRDSIR